jgi:hypothetical protein
MPDRPEALPIAGVAPKNPVLYKVSNLLTVGHMLSFLRTAEGNELRPTSITSRPRTAMAGGAGDGSVEEPVGGAADYAAAYAGES